MADDAKLMHVDPDADLERIDQAIRLIEKVNRLTQRVQRIVERNQGDEGLRVDQIGIPLDSRWRKSVDALRDECNKLHPDPS